MMTENKDIDYSKMKANKFGPNNQTSARVIVKLLVDAIHPTSVLDIGCGVGVWLKEFRKYPCVEKIQGIDGAWVLDWPLDVPREVIEYMILRICQSIRSVLLRTKDLILPFAWRWQSMFPLDEPNSSWTLYPKLQMSYIFRQQLLIRGGASRT